MLAIAASEVGWRRANEGAVKTGVTVDSSAEIEVANRTTLLASAAFTDVFHTLRCRWTCRAGGDLAHSLCL
jgi:hypothetical protein